MIEKKKTKIILYCIRSYNIIEYYFKHAYPEYYRRLFSIFSFHATQSLLYSSMFYDIIRKIFFFFYSIL